jgi:hypothetical protein
MVFPNILKAPGLEERPGLKIAATSQNSESVTTSRSCESVEKCLETALDRVPNKTFEDNPAKLPHFCGYLVTRNDDAL